MEQLSFLWLLPWVFAIACLGRITLKLFKCPKLVGIPHFTFSYWLGYVVAGFIFTLASLVGFLTFYFVATFLTLSALTVFIRNQRKPHFKNFDTGHFLSLLFILGALLTLPASMIPPVEHSSLAFHFALPKNIADTGQLTVNIYSHLHAGPPLSQVLSASAYLMAGETLMMLHNWFMMVMAGLATFTLARNRLRTAPSWLFATLILTIPALTYTAGTGIIEPRLMGLIALSALALFYYARSERKAWLILSAVMITGACNMHIIGIFALTALCLALLLIAKNFGYKKFFGHIFIYLSVILLLSGPFYIWLYQASSAFFYPFTGEMTTPENWSIAQKLFFENHISTITSESMARTKANMMFTYPLEMTMNAREWNTSHLSLGPIFLMALVPSFMLFVRRFPFFSPEKLIGTLELQTVIFFTYYVLWFFYGYSMAPHYLLPVFPLLALPAFVLGQNLMARSAFAMRATMLASVFVLISIQLGISVGMNKPAMAVFFKKDDLQTYIAYKAPALIVAEYLENNMKDEDKVLHTELSAMHYKLGQKGFYAPTIFQEKVPTAYGTASQILNAALLEKVTLWVTKNNVMHEKYDTSYNAHKALRKLVEYGCFKEEKQLKSKRDEYFYIYRYVPKCGNTLKTS